jgi:hypothetical protein
VVASTDAIQEALEKIYPAPALVKELGGTPTASGQGGVERGSAR